MSSEKTENNDWGWGKAIFFLMSLSILVPFFLQIGTPRTIHSENFVSHYNKAETCSRWDYIGTKAETNGSVKQELFRCASEKGFYVEKTTFVKDGKIKRGLSFLFEEAEGDLVKLKRVANAIQKDFELKRNAGFSDDENYGFMDEKANHYFDKAWQLSETKKNNLITQN